MNCWIAFSVAFVHGENPPLKAIHEVRGNNAVKTASMKIT